MGSPRIILTGLGPKLQGLHWETSTVLRVGRQNTLDVVLPDYSVDRLHGEVVYSHSRWILRNLAGSELHPTLVNGKPLVMGTHAIKLLDTLQFGKLSLQVTTLEESDVAKAIRPEAAPSSSNIPSPNYVRNGSGVHPTEQIKTSGAFVKVEARTHQSWDQALAKATQGSDFRQQNQAMMTLVRANHHLCHIANLEELVHSILNDAITALGAQRGSIILLDDNTGQLVLKSNITTGVPASIDRCYSKTLVERCFRRGESLLCRDVNADNDLLMARSVRQGSMTSILCALLRSPRKRIGILQLDRGPFQEQFTEKDLYLADALAASAAVGIESSQLVELQREQFIQTVTTLARTVEMRDQYTGDHTKRVTDYALLLAEEMKLPVGDKYQIQVGTPLHDIGKIAIDDAILRKPGKLTASEFEFMKTHTSKGAAILQAIYSLAPMLPIVRHHHERWDGRGYPDGLAEDQIAQTARIVAVADAFDAMTSQRPYRPAMHVDLAFLELVKHSGTHFDPVCVQAFCRQRQKIERMLNS